MIIMPLTSGHGFESRQNDASLHRAIHVHLPRAGPGKEKARRIPLRDVKGCLKGAARLP